MFIQDQRTEMIARNCLHYLPARPKHYVRPRQELKVRYKAGVSTAGMSLDGRVEPPAGATVASWLVTTLCCQRRPAASEHRKFAVHRSIQSVSDKRAFHARPCEWYEL